MNLEDLFKIWDRFERSDISRLAFENETGKIELEKGKAETVVPAMNFAMPAAQMPAATQLAATPAAPATANAPEAKANTEDKGTVIKAPFVGTFYRSPGPDEAPYIQVGQKVKKGDTLCIVEAMKVMNEIVSPADGVVAAIFVEDDTLVEYDQKLVSIEEV